LAGYTSHVLMALGFFNFMRSFKETLRKMRNHIDQIKLDKCEESDETVSKILLLSDIVYFLKNDPSIEDVNKLHDQISELNSNNDSLPF